VISVELQEQLAQAQHKAPATLHLQVPIGLESPCEGLQTAPLRGGEGRGRSRKGAEHEAAVGVPPPLKVREAAISLQLAGVLQHTTPALRVSGE
jgi:hypothetical protein